MLVGFSADIVIYLPLIDGEQPVRGVSAREMGSNHATGRGLCPEVCIRQNYFAIIGRQ